MSLSLQQHLVLHGGATLDSALSPISMESGYMCSIEASELRFSTISELLDCLSDYVLQPNCFIGIWHGSDGLWYLDNSCYFEDYSSAVAFGCENHQQAIYDWAHDMSLYITSDGVC